MTDRSPDAPSGGPRSGEGGDTPAVTGDAVPGDDAATYPAVDLTKTSNIEWWLDNCTQSGIAPGGWAYDPIGDVWVIVDALHQGPGRGFLVIRRGGTWIRAVLQPHEVM